MGSMSGIILSSIVWRNYELITSLFCSDALKLRQAKLAFPSVHLMVGVFSDQALQIHNQSSNRPEIERAELVRHCRWTDEAVRDVPWELTLQFLIDKSIDFVAIDEGTSIDPNCDKARVLAYDELKKHGTLTLYLSNRNLF